jgi:16S rRNA (adenine1518-N6/adenine1519-N6)-dimethyltransferase
VKHAFPSANKKLGQHFLVSQKVIQAIVGSRPPEHDAILEIGPGPAVITKPLSEIKMPLHVIEMDDRFVPNLKELMPEENILLKDMLEVDLDTLPWMKKYHHWWVVSNLPYNVGVPITLKLFRSKSCEHLTLMMQKEVALKFLPREPKEMNSLQALSHFFFHVERVIHVPPGAFVPPPQVDSEVLAFHRLKDPLVPLEEWNEVEAFFRILFAHPRKQIGGILKKSFPQFDFDQVFRDIMIPKEIRAEALNLKEVKQLYVAFRPHLSLSK